MHFANSAINQALKLNKNDYKTGKSKISSIAIMQNDKKGPGNTLPGDPDYHLHG